MNLQKRIYKFFLSMIHIRGEVPNAKLKQRMENDPELREHWQSEEELTRSLRSGKDPCVPVPEMLRNRIVNGLEPEMEKPIPLRSPLSIGWMTSAAAAVLAFAALLIVVQSGGPTDDGNQAGPAPAVQQSTERPGAPITLQSPIENHPLVKLSAIVESPLREEPQRLLNDAESALRFLSATFVPSKSLRNEVVNSLLGDKAEALLDSDA